MRELHVAVRGSDVREHAVVTASRRSRRPLKIAQLVSVAAWWWTGRAPGLGLVIVQAGHVRCRVAVAESGRGVDAAGKIRARQARHCRLLLCLGACVCVRRWLGLGDGT